MPAAAVIPAPLAYIKVVAVKKLVVDSIRQCRQSLFRKSVSLSRAFLGFCYFEKNRVFQAG